VKWISTPNGSGITRSGNAHTSGLGAGVVTDVADVADTIRVSMGITIVGSGVGYSVGGGIDVIVGDGTGASIWLGLGEGCEVSASAEASIGASETGAAQLPSAISPAAPISPATSHGIPRLPNRALTIARVYLNSGGEPEDGCWVLDARTCLSGGHYWLLRKQSTIRWGRCPP